MRFLSHIFLLSFILLLPLAVSIQAQSLSPDQFLSILMTGAARATTANAFFACPDGAIQCEGLTAQICSGGVWKVNQYCASGCVNGYCAGGTTPTPPSPPPQTAPSAPSSYSGGLIPYNSTNQTFQCSGYNNIGHWSPGQICQDDCQATLANKFGWGGNWSCTPNCTCTGSNSSYTYCSSGIKLAPGNICYDDCNQTFGSNFTCTSNCTCAKKTLPPQPTNATCSSGNWSAGSYCIDDCDVQYGPSFVCTSNCTCQSAVVPLPRNNSCSMGAVPAPGTTPPPHAGVCRDDCAQAYGSNYACDPAGCFCKLNFTLCSWGTGSQYNTTCRDDCASKFGSNSTCTSNCTCAPKGVIRPAPETGPSGSVVATANPLSCFVGNFIGFFTGAPKSPGC